jgi:2-amino-4-hydroxy-6-hydroxymethyldihydropteridine diphosphokinase
MRAYVAVGSNLGDRWARLAQAARALRAAPGVAVVRGSRVWDAAPVGPPQPRYLNAVLELETTRTPAALLALLRQVEQAAGRTRDVHWGARTLDLDLLLYGHLTVREPGLTVPHPGMESRRFVLAPLAELHPQLLVPGTGLRVWRLLEESPELDLEPVGAYPL